MFTHGSTKAEVKSVGQLALMLDLLSLEPNVRNPVLPATIGATGHVQLQLLIELRQTLFHLINQPPCKALGLGNRQLAELRACARHRAPPEHRSFHVQSNLAQLPSQFAGLRLRHIDNHQVL